MKKSIGLKNKANPEDYEVNLDNYDWSKAKKNPLAKKLKKQITINLSIRVLDYFKMQSERSGIPYQTLINSYLLDCSINDKLRIPWLDNDN